MKFIYLFPIFMIVASSCHSKAKDENKTEAPSHEIFNKVLQEHVHGDEFDYKSLKENQAEFNNYLSLLSSKPPSDNWTKNERLAYWINAYNAFTLKLIIDNYPVESIQDLHPTIYLPLLNTVWHKKFFKIGGEETSLDEIEHKILRKKFNEPRIHFAINCASISCPPLRNEAFMPAIINEQLDDQARNFINDESRNKLETDKIEISKIFSWFSGDFKKEMSLIDFINQYSNVQIANDADIDYMDYNWSLNDVN